ncbi:MAG: hypothetical protein EA369_09805 [Bradymonadales bacterium]|nr:MAG: hypothetical protein EA369_09805 [Bradymonadales bacterium]
MQSSSSKFLWLLLFLLLPACAAQDSFRQYERSRALLEAAEKVDPVHPRIEPARLALEAGFEALQAGRYSQADRRLRQVERWAEDILEEDREWRMEPESPVQVEGADEEKAVEVTKKVEPSPVVEIEARPDPSQMELPAQALASYLARKREFSEAEEPEPEPEPEVPARAPQPDIPVPEGAIVLQSGSEARSQRREPADEVAQDEESPPSLDEMAEDPAPRAASTAPEAEKGRSPVPNGSLSFDEGQLGLSPRVMDRLDQMSVFLLNNPSNTLILEGTRAPSEADSIVRGRFEAVRAYLIGKGVPDDQVRLEDAINSASSGEVRMSLIEH